MKLREITEIEDIKKSFRVMQQVYDNVPNRENFVKPAYHILDNGIDEYSSRILRMRRNGYMIGGVFEDENVDNGQCIGIIGARIKVSLRFGDVIEIEDFMIDRQRRGIGVGKMLIKWVEWQAIINKCNAIYGSLGETRIPSQEIYKREKFLVEGVSFYKYV